MSTKDLSIGYLFDFYGELLTPRQKEMFSLYYNDDLSLSEIAEQVGITRQGVRDTVKKTGEQLADFEKKLGLAEKFREISETSEKIIAKLTAMEKNSGGRADDFEEIISEVKRLSELQ